MYQFAVLYRIGGTQRFLWRKSIAMTRYQMVESFKTMRRAGYTCYAVNRNEPIPTDYLGENIVCERLTAEEMTA